MAKMMRVTDETNETLDSLQESTGKTKQALIELAVKKLYKEQFFYQANKAYENLKKDPVAWQEEQEERKQLDGALADGLKDE